MTQTLFDSLQGLNSEVVAVGTLLGPSEFVDGGNTNDEEDIFQCGKCKKQFFSLGTFMVHKKTHQLNDFPSSQKLLAEGAVTAAEEPELQLQPIVLSESDILSFSIGQAGLSLSSADQGLNDFENNEDLMLPDADDSELKESSDAPNQSSNLQFRSAQVILATQINSNDKAVPVTLILPETNDKPEKETSFTAEDTSLVLDQSSMLEITKEEEDDKKPGAVVKEHGAKKMQCSICSKEFTKNFDLAQHLRSHTGERPYQCLICGRSFTQKSNVTKHMRTHKIWPQKIRTLPEKLVEKTAINTPHLEVLVNDTFACQFCPETFNSYIQLKSHRKIHAESKKFRCVQSKCGKVFESLQELLEHSDSHKASGDVQFRCAICRETFTNLDELSNHQNIHPPVKNKQGYVACKVCKARFATIEKLAIHQMDDPHSYTCPECSKVFVCERHLRRHLITHSSIPIHTCNECGKTFKTLQNLSIHQLIHSGEKSFTCKLCPAAFVRQDRLARHMQMHDPMCKLKCPFLKTLGCKKEFYRKDKLKQHILTHANMKTLKCKGCPRMFKGRVQLRRHESVCMGDKPCKDCGHVTASLDCYRDSNFKAKHPGNRRKPKSSNNRKTPKDGVSTIQVVVVPLDSSEVAPSS